MAKSRGLEKGGRRERIFALGWLRAVQSFVREGPCLLGIFARSQAGREYFVRCDWRSEPVSNSRYSSKRGLRAMGRAGIWARQLTGCDRGGSVHPRIPSTSLTFLGPFRNADRLEAL